MVGVYKIINSITGEFYIGSSRNIQRRWQQHRCQSTWKNKPNSILYADMKHYGTDKFIFEVIEEMSDVSQLKSREQYYIELYHPGYNKRVANTGLDTTDKNEYMKQYEKLDKCKQYYQSEKYKQQKRQYYTRICEYNGERLTLDALRTRFRRMRIEHSFVEAKKYLIE